MEEGNEALEGVPKRVRVPVYKAVMVITKVCFVPLGDGDHVVDCGVACAESMTVD